MMKDITTVALLAVTLGALGSCQHNTGSADNPAKNASEAIRQGTQQEQPNKEDNKGKVTRKTAEAIAVKEVMARTKLEARQLEAAQSKLEGDVWNVLVCKVPSRVGGFWNVYVTDKGTITDFEGGE